MKKLLLSCCLACASLAASAQADPIVMRVNGQPVTRSEFEYNFNKNNGEGVLDKKTVEEYADLFINYKLKVFAALDAKLDTLSSFQEEFHTYRDQQIRPLLLPPNTIDTESRAYYDKMLSSLQGKNLIKPAHIFLRLPQNATPEVQAKTKERIDSVAQALKDGADFAELAKKVSQDPSTAVQGGALPWIGPNQTLKEFEDAAYALKPGETTEPILTTVGFHIIKLLETKQLEDYETLKPNIQRFLESQGLEERLSAQVLDSMSRDSQKTIEEILDDETERLCKEDLDLKYLVQEYHDGLLLFEICNREVWEPASRDTTGMVNYFKQNRKQYAWDEPRFSGMIYYCRQAGDVKAVKKALKKVPADKWTTTIREKFNADSVTVRMEKRVFKQGENANVDAIALKVKGAKTAEIKGFPYVGTLGKKLKKGPAEWTDVSSQVVTDYQRKREEEYVDQLRKKYTFEIDKDVLKTVNNH